MLTKKQEKLLRIIHGKMKDSGVSPSYDEMSEMMKIKSKSSIYRLIRGLEERGFIRRLHGRSRSIEVIRLPEVIMTVLTDRSLPNYNSSYFDSSKSDGSSPGDNGELEDRVGTVDIPVMGKIAASVPVKVIQNQSHSIPVPKEFITKDEHFALEINSDSMMDAGILEGDTVLIRKENTALYGDIVLAFVDKKEATLKRFRMKNGSIALEAANEDYKIQTYEPDRVSIQGKLVGLIRRY